MAFKVKVIYRNYIPLYSAYSSFWLSPIAGLDIEIPKVKPLLNKLYPLYRTFNFLPGFQRLIKFVQNVFFTTKSQHPSDVYFFAGMPPPANMHQPFVIDLEHIYALLNFTPETEETRKEALEALRSPFCRAILPWSEAAKQTLQDWLGGHDSEILSKTQTLYPALPSYLETYEPDYSIIEKKKGLFHLLFVGKDPYRKGLQEVLPAFEAALKKNPNLRLWVVSDTPRELYRRYRYIPEINFFKPVFSHEELLKKLFLPSHVFVMPTHADTFGMSYLEALSCGKPVIATSQFALPEIITHEKHGLLLKHQRLFLDKAGLPKERNGKDYLLSEKESLNLIQQLTDSILKIVNNPDAYKEMSKNAASLFHSGGKFSLSERNRNLQLIFSRCL